MKALIISLLLGYTLALNAQTNVDLLFKAAKSNDTITLSKLLNDGVDVNSKSDYGATPLLFAVDKGNFEATKILLEKGADPNAKDGFYQTTPYYWAVTSNKSEITSLLIYHGADFQESWMFAYCVNQGFNEMVSVLLKAKAPGVEEALKTAVNKSNIEMVKLLLDGANFSPEVLSQSMAIAFNQNSDEIISLLTAAGGIMPELAQNNIEVDLSGSYVKDGFKIIVSKENQNYSASFDGSNPYDLQFDSVTTFSFVAFPAVKLKFNIVEDKVIGFNYLEGEKNESFLKSEETDENKLSSSFVNLQGDVKEVLNWNSFRGVNATGIADGQFPPAKWDVSTGLNLSWKTFIPGLSHACPITYDDRIYIVSVEGQDSTSEYRVGLYGDVEPANDTSVHVWRIYCLDKKDGHIVWQKDAYEGKPRVQRHTKATFANSTPVTDGNRIVALFGSQGMVCYDMNGEEKWRIDLGVLDAGWFFEEETQWGHSSSPIIYKDMVIVQVDRSKDSYIAAFNLKTGKEVWKTNREAISSWGTPAIFQDGSQDEVITNGTKYIRSYDPNTGNELWKLGPNSEVTVATPVVYNDVFFVTAGYPPVRPIYAIKPGGKGDISIADTVNSGDFIKWKNSKDGTYMPSPIAYQGYFYTLANNGVLCCYDIETGEKKYRKNLKGGAFTASIIAADGKLYCTSEEKGVYVVKAGAEYELISINPIGETCLATPAISDGMVIVRGQKHVFGFK